VPWSYDHLMAVTGFIMTFLSTSAAVVSSWIAYATYRHDREESEHRKDAGAHSSQSSATYSRWFKLNVALAVSALCILGIGISLIAQSGGSSRSISSPPSTQPSSTTANTPPGPGVSSNHSALGWSKQWGPNTLNFASGADVNLDSVPPNVSSDVADSSFGLANNTFNDDSTVVDWTEKGIGAPTAAACADLIARFGGLTSLPVTGHVYCAKSRHGRVAIITVDRIYLDSNDSMTGTLVSATAWTHN
jgi:hypothetical protein